MRVWGMHIAAKKQDHICELRFVIRTAGLRRALRPLECKYVTSFFYQLIFWRASRSPNPRSWVLSRWTWWTPTPVLRFPSHREAIGRCRFRPWLRPSGIFRSALAFAFARCNATEVPGEKETNYYKSRNMESSCRTRGSYAKSKWRWLTAVKLSMIH